MTFIGSLALVLTMALALPAHAGPRPVTVDDLMRLRTINDACISPDGRQVVYSVSTPSYESDAHDAVLYMVPAAGGPSTRLTYTTRVFNRPVPLPLLRWSPDGRTVSFLGLVNEIPQVMALDVSGGEARALTSAKAGIVAYEWSPSGADIAYITPDPPSEEEERRKREKSWVIHVDRQNPSVRLWVQPVSGGAPRSLTPAEHFVSGLSWAPDGATLAYSASLGTGFMARFDGVLYAVAAAGGTPRPLVARPGMNTSPRYSPDGRWIAFTSTGGRRELVSIWGLHVVRADGSETRDLSAKNETWAGEYLWTPDSRALLQSPDEGTSRRGAQMFDRPILRVSVDPGPDRVLTPDKVVAYQPSLSRDGRLLAYRSVEPRTMGELVVMEVSTQRITTLTDINPQLKELALGALEPVHWTSFDGMDIWGLLLTPPGYRPGTRVPLVVYAHGGPIGGFTYGIFPQFMHRPGQVDFYPSEAMASAGMAVLFPMPRGGSGYGEAGFRMILKGWGDGDYKDILAGVDQMIARGIADPDRLGVMGASYGGFMASWIVTQTDRFKAASTGASTNDLEDLYYLSDAGEVTAEYFGPPWDAPELYRAHSPVTYAARVKTPLLIQHGENDRRVPLPLAIKFYRALKAHGKTVELDIHPRGGHVLYEPDLEREQMQRNLEWFKKWLAPTPFLTSPQGSDSK